MSLEKEEIIEKAKRISIEFGEALSSLGDYINNLEKCEDTEVRLSAALKLNDSLSSQISEYRSELQQTKEKLKRCEEFLRDINLNHALVYRVEQFLTQLKDNG